MEAVIKEHLDIIRSSIDTINNTTEKSLEWKLDISKAHLRKCTGNKGEESTGMLLDIKVKLVIGNDDLIDATVVETYVCNKCDKTMHFPLEKPS